MSTVNNKQTSAGLCNVENKLKYFKTEKNVGGKSVTIHVGAHKQTKKTILATKPKEKNKLNILLNF